MTVTAVSSGRQTTGSDRSSGAVAKGQPPAPRERRLGGILCDGAARDALLHLRIFGAIGAVPSKKLGGYVGAPERVGQTSGASLATPRRRRHFILPTALGTDCGGWNISGVTSPR
jgi:hypothetical protein